MSFKRTSQSPFRRFKPYIAATVLGALVSLPVLLLMSLALFLLQLPVEWAGGMSLFALGSGCVCSGIILGRRLRRNGLLLGAQGGILLCLLCLLGAVFTGGFTGGQAAVKIIVAIITGCSGGVIGVNSKEKL